MNRSGSPGAGQDALGVLLAQLASIDRWAVLESERAATPAVKPSREDRMHQVYVAGAFAREVAALSFAADLPDAPRDRPRAVLLHRQEWFRSKVAHCLDEFGVTVVHVDDDGAEGCGAAIALAPDLLLVEGALPSFTASQVIARVRHCSPATLIVAQVAHDELVPALTDAGAVRTWHRRVPPGDVARAMAEMVRGDGAGDLPVVG